ncbi:MAG: class I SAM-dependent methyltransferase [Opitutales bacterium]|jgi:hypothetical protein|nr:class I SAM-dependent methyltransferase [Opitutales bacterium]MDP4642837.1 class I SAM-dependent methyltransferase [Opitutales bacterium]MDP4645260.1 class I SAM-dependent methyltransferase [Opitutales bacterium]MDP4776320.1 class I SAM-dependent methyltransferase [Opitutales bacterium]MDP4878959.1 class I SAM-dependent methyltransferase [Opitutales bacterium]
MPRKVRPEILDSLPASDPDALASRRDLKRINQLMGNTRWLIKQLKVNSAETAPHYLEIGAGDGTLAKHLIHHLHPKQYTALDLAPCPSEWPKGDDEQWKQADLLHEDNYATATHLIANLVLHHFEAPALEQIGRHIHDHNIQTILCCEPCRRTIHKAQLLAGKLIGFNQVTLHDGCVSIDAGFRQNELPLALGLQPDQWQWKIQETLMGAYRMIAQRRP